MVMAIQQKLLPPKDKIIRPVFSNVSRSGKLLSFYIEVSLLNGISTLKGYLAKDILLE